MMIKPPQDHAGISSTYSSVVSIFPFLPLLGFVAALVSFGFCIGLVLVPFFGDRYQGSLGFISDGMDFYCGWSSAVLCSCGLFIAACEVVAALHTHISSSLLLAVFIQTPSWCIIIGVSGTGWHVHYAALTFFMLATFYFHWRFAAAHTLAYRVCIYRTANRLTAFNLVAFFLSFVVLEVMQQPYPRRIAKDVAVSLEITLLCCITAQTCCLLWVLLQYTNIHIRFDHDE
jgi:hypothetical protein